MNTQTHNYPLFRIPEKIDSCLFLIAEELKCRKLFNAFHEIGLDDCYFQPHLDTLILHYLHLDTSDSVFALYDQIMTKRTQKIDGSRSSIARQALKAYHELIVLRNTLANPGQRQG